MDHKTLIYVKHFSVQKHFAFIINTRIMNHIAGQLSHGNRISNFININILSTRNTQ